MLRLIRIYSLFYSDFLGGIFVAIVYSKNASVSNIVSTPSAYLSIALYQDFSSSYLSAYGSSYSCSFLFSSGFN